MSNMVGFILTIFNVALVIWCCLASMSWESEHRESFSTYLVLPALLILCAASSLGSVWLYYYLLTGGPC